MVQIVEEKTEKFLPELTEFTLKDFKINLYSILAPYEIDHINILRFFVGDDNNCYLQKIYKDKNQVITCNSITSRLLFQLYGILTKTYSELDFDGNSFIIQEENGYKGPIYTLLRKK